MPTLVDSYVYYNASSYWMMYLGNAIKLAQSFTGNGTILDSAKFYGSKYGSPTGNIYAVLYAHTGTYGSTGKPTGSALAISNAVDITTLSTSNDLINFTFSGANRVTLVNGTKYFISLEYSGGDSSNYLRGYYDITSPTHSGNYSRYYSGAWAYDSARDTIFYVYSADVEVWQPIPTFRNP